MVRVFILIVCVGVAGFIAGFAPSILGEAQAQIYLRKGDSKDTGAAPAAPTPAPRGAIYLRRDDTNPSRQGAAGGNYGAELREAREFRRVVNNDLQALKYWEESGRKPQTVEEVRSYANAFSLANRLAMLEERERVMPPIIAAKKKQLEAYQAELLAQAGDFDAAGGADGGAGVPAQAAGSNVGAQTQKSGERVIYRRSSNSEPPKPTRVFRDYR